MPPPPPPPTARPSFSRLASADVDPEEGGKDDDCGPAHRGIMDLRDIATGATAAAEEPSLLPPPLPTLELLLTTPRLLLLLPPLLADDGLDDGLDGGLDGGGSSLACAPAWVCRRGLTGMAGFVCAAAGQPMSKSHPKTPLNRTSH